MPKKHLHRITGLFLIVVALHHLAGCQASLHEIPLPANGDCPAAILNQRVICEGFISNENGVATELLESKAPIRTITFTLHPKKHLGPRTSNSFRIGLRDYDKEKQVGSKANQIEMYYSAHNNHWDIYDHQGDPIDFERKVRVTGKLIDRCLLQVEKIERL